MIRAIAVVLLTLREDMCAFTQDAHIVTMLQHVPDALTTSFFRFMIDYLVGGNDFPQ